MSKQSKKPRTSRFVETGEGVTITKRDGTKIRMDDKKGGKKK